MTDKEKVIKEIILKNPNLSGNKIYEITKAKGVGIRKTDFYKLFRETKNLPEPSITKREQSIPIKYKVAKPKVAKPKIAKTKVQKKIIPFAETKFGKITKGLQDGHRISEKKAIIRARALLKIPRTDYDKLDEIDVQILLHETP